MSDSPAWRVTPSELSLHPVHDPAHIEGDIEVRLVSRDPFVLVNTFAPNTKVAAHSHGCDTLYLFHAGESAAPDLGTRSFQCSRRADVVKLWVALQRLGADGIGALYDHLCGLARTLHAMLAADPVRFEVLHAPESNILCFRVRGSDEANLRVREAFNRSGRGWITTTVLDGRRVLRVTVMNPRTGEAELRALVDGLAGLAASMGTTASEGGA